MASTLTFRQFISLAFFLFSMFLGAGNIIFAPPLGQAAGTSLWVAMGGFLITGVGLVLLAIMALSIAGGSIETLASRVNPGFAKFFSILLFLTLGPIYVVPRTSAVVYEVSLVPFLPASLPSGTGWVMFVFSAFFIGLTILLTLEPKKLVARMGDVLTPIFLVLLTIIVAKSFLTPIGPWGAPSGPYVEHAFGKGFTIGYFTMDVLAAFVFGKIFLDAARNAGVRSHQMSSLFVRAGAFAVISLALVQIALACMGASSVSVMGVSANGGEALPKLVHLLLGNLGVGMLACVVMLTGLTTAIACLAAVSEYFSRIYPQLSYKGWVWAFGLLSLCIANFGLTTILKYATPVLLFLYPIAIALIALVFLNRFFGGHRAVYVGTVVGAGLMGFFDGLQDINLLPQPLLEALAANLPLHSAGMGWIVFAVVGGVLGFAYSKLGSSSEVGFVNTPVA